MYSLIQPIFAKFDPEDSHVFAFRALKLLFKIPGIPSLIKKKYLLNDPRLVRTVAGLTFQNPVGLAAGLDKNAYLFNELAAFGFGFIEVGTITPKPQPGNDRPRLFRLQQDRAIINRMGFNGEGVAVATSRLAKGKTPGLIVGGNIGKNKVTPNDQATLDYVACFKALFPYVDYFVVNVSSPNTPGLRALQEKEPLTNLLNHLQKLNQAKPATKPIFLKIAPDLTNEQLDDIIEIVKTTKIAGLIATNTTTERDGLATPANQVASLGAGGLSGTPLNKRNTEIIKYLHTKSGGAFPIIAVGGIMTPEDALEKIKAGAALVQIYTGFIYNGPSLVKKINQAILAQN